MLYAQLNNFVVTQENAMLAISQDEMKEIAKLNKVSVKSVAVQIDIINALIHRMNYQSQVEQIKVNNVFISEFRSMSSASVLQQIEALHKQKFDLSNVASLVKITKDQNSDDFCAIYAVEKIFNLLRCLASKDENKLNAYTKAILVNLLEHGTLTIDECKSAVSLEWFTKCNRSRSVGQKQIRNLYHSAHSTAGTQVSSSRMCLKALSVCNVQKNSTKDEITFNEEAQYTQAVLNLLKMRDASESELDRIADKLENELKAKETKKAS